VTKRVEMIRFDMPEWNPVEVTHHEWAEDAMAEACRYMGIADTEWGDTQIGYEGFDRSKAEYAEEALMVFHITGYDEATREAREIADEDHKGE